MAEHDPLGHKIWHKDAAGGRLLEHSLCLCVDGLLCSISKARQSTRIDSLPRTCGRPHARDSIFKGAVKEMLKHAAANHKCRAPSLIPLLRYMPPLST